MISRRRVEQMWILVQEILENIQVLLHRNEDFIGDI